MPLEPVDRPALDPDAIASHAFARARKGYEPDEVRAFLVQLASQIRLSEQRRNDLERRVVELERRATDPRDLDEAAVTELLGEETARVLESARTAAAEIRARAEEQATTATTGANEAAAATRTAADQYADEERTAADEYAATIRAVTDQEVAQQRAEANAAVEGMRTEAESVLVDRTAEADVAAAAVRADGDGYRDRVREEADHYSESTRTAADGYRADVHGAADAYRESATAEADQLRADATAAAATLRHDAEAAATARREAIEAEADGVLAEARDQGRVMVQEARTYRERVIADLADRRRAARNQLEQLAAARDALAVTLTDVAGRIEASHRSLQDAVVDPGEGGDLGADRRALEAGEAPATAIAVGEIDGTAEDSAPGVPDDAEAAEDDAPPDVGDEDEGGGVLAGAATGAETTSSTEDVAAAHEAPPRNGTPPGGPSAGATEAATSDSQPGGGDEAVVDDIFARIRAERQHEETVPGRPEDHAEPTGSADAADATDPSSAASAAGLAAGGVAVAVAVEGSGGDADLLDRRDATTDELERQLARRLKRVLSDEQNEALDLLRRSRGTPTASEVLPGEEDHLARYTTAALEDLTAAERAGAAFFGDAPEGAADVRDVAVEFAAEMVRQLRERLRRAFDDGGDEDEVGERIRACYREWKTQRIAEVARHYVMVAFSRGVSEAAPDGARFRWVVDHGEAASPDCDDNALAGMVPKGEPFPTGDLCPPAHPGCRCLAVPADA
ncbi:hypothetical protein BH23ACT2_BH23ACT2_30710 [soil metagenome]